MNPEHLYAPAELKFAPGDAPGEFEGYGSVFGNEDAHGDVVLRGAFKDSLAQHKARGTMPGLYIEHGPFTGGDRLPAGVWTDLVEDERGLRGRGKISALDTDYGRRVHGLMRDGALRGLSIAFAVPPNGATYGKGAGQPRRTLKAIDLKAVDLVTAPSNSAAGVIQVKNIGSRAELEDLLIEAGLARGAARKVSGAGWPALSGEPDAPPPDPAATELLKRLDHNVTDLKSLKGLFR